MTGRNTTWIAAIAAVAIVSTDVSARLPGTLNFQNVTDTNVAQTSNDDGEKEVEFGDFDNDGDLDAVIANGQSDFGALRNRLYRNDDGVMTEISGAPMIPGFSGADVTRNAFLRDYNNDGWLDIIVINDRNSAGEAGRTKVYVNKQEKGQFARFDEEGVQRLGAGSGGAACSGISVDHNGDGEMDLYAGNYPNNSQDTMYFNDGTGNFTAVPANLPTDSDYTVDVSSADLNGDGKMDIVISNWGTKRIYYNDLNSSSSGEGDYNYTGSRQQLPGGHSSENAMEPGDFDNDGDVDIYHSQGQNNGDLIFVNNGNLINGQVEWQTMTNLPASVRTTISRKATVVDLNHDGRLDVFVMSGNDRPTVLRNTSVNGEISFIDWTPPGVFDGSNSGWHAAAFHVNDDEYEDIFLGGFSGERLFVAADSTEVMESNMKSRTLPDFHDTDPIAVVGTVSETDIYYVRVGGFNHELSFVLNTFDSCADLSLEVRNLSGTKVLGTSDRGGDNVEEVLRVLPPAVRGVQVRVTANSICEGDSARYILEGLSR